MTGTREPAPRSFTSTPEATKESSVQTHPPSPSESLQFARFQREAAACRRRSVLSARRKRSRRRAEPRPPARSRSPALPRSSCTARPVAESARRARRGTRRCACAWPGRAGRPRAGPPLRARRPRACGGPPRSTWSRPGGRAWAGASSLRRRAQVLRQHRGRVHVGVRAEHAELVAAQARGQVAGAQASGQNARRPPSSTRSPVA